jgi:hypothetical protein
VNIGSIQIAQTAPLVLQSFGPAILKTAAALTTRGELNAFLFLLNGVLNSSEVGFPRLEMPESGNQAGDAPAPFGQSTGKDTVENKNGAKDRRELQPMVSHIPLEPVPAMAGAPLFAVVPQLETKHNASVIFLERLPSSIEPESSATPPRVVSNGDAHPASALPVNAWGQFGSARAHDSDTRTGRALPIDAALESLTDVALALRISPKDGGFQNAALVAERNGTPWRSSIEPEPSGPVAACRVFTDDVQHVAAAQTPGSFTPNPIVMDKPLAGPSDSSQIQSSLVQGEASGTWAQQDASNNESPVPASPTPAPTDAGGDIPASINLRSAPDMKPGFVEYRHSLPANPTVVPKNLNREGARPLDPSQIPEVARAGSSTSPPSALRQPTLEPRSGPASAQTEDSSQEPRPVESRTSETNAGAASEARQAAPKTIPPLQQETRQPAIDCAGQSRNSFLKQRQDSPETRAETKGLESLPAKPNSAPMGRASTPHESKPEISGMVSRGIVPRRIVPPGIVSSGNVSPGIVSPGIVSRGVVGNSIRDIPSDRVRANLPSASNPPPETATKDLTPSQPVRQISFKLADAASNNVNVLFTEKAGRVEVAVRTPDQNLTKSLQAELGDLVTRLDASGFRTETWAPTATHHAPTSLAEPSNSTNSQGQPSSSGSWSGNQQQQREHHEPNQRQQPRWMAQLDESLTEEDKRIENE